MRDLRNLTVLDLSRTTRMSVKRIEALESGQELWLSIRDRTILARALGVQPSVIQEVETCPSAMSDERKQSIKAIDEIADRILAGEVQISCPQCGSILKVSVEDALDFEGRPTQFPRGYCPVCPFSLR